MNSEKKLPIAKRNLNQKFNEKILCKMEKFFHYVLYKQGRRKKQNNPN